MDVDPLPLSLLCRSKSHKRSGFIVIEITTNSSIEQKTALANDTIFLREHNIMQMEL